MAHTLFSSRLLGIVLFILGSSGCGRTTFYPLDEPVSPHEICNNSRDDDGDTLVDCRDPDCEDDPACKNPREICDNLLDDDNDGFVDCQDTDCRGESQCSAPPEICDNFYDDDLDGLIDCNDPDCFGDRFCKTLPEICNNFLDDDYDGLVDCQDPQCFRDPACRKQEICNNFYDDDNDGFVDCQDPDCKTALHCQVAPEICNNFYDDDNDNLVDCNDPDCFAEPICQLRPEICDNFFDDDGDGLIDCQDPQCFTYPTCIKIEICDNYIDDNFNGLTDCDDPPCFTHPFCTKKEICDNKLDDDQNGLIDCKDPACAQDPYCTQKEEICDNGIDDDGDGLIDCEDSHCVGHPYCQVKKELCTNFIDDDGDGLIDCNDPDCFKHPNCKKPGVEICNNGVDDDEDGDVDCDDSDCVWLPICQSGQEICDNQLDDDHDGAADCDDPDCKDFPNCVTLLCNPTVDFGVIYPQGSTSTRQFNTLATKDIYLSTCVVPGGGELVTKFTLVDQTDLKLEYQQFTGDHVFALFKAGIGESCNANPVDCFDPESAKTGAFSIKALEAGVYYLIMEAFASGIEGEGQVTLSTGPGTQLEICNNGVDDDGDLAIDCADLDCVLTPDCATQLCDVDVNLGTLVINGPSKNANVDTATGGNDIEETCAAGGGGDRVIRFVMPESGGMSVTVFQEGWHVLGLHSDMGPGTTCSADKGSCFDTNQSGGFILVYDQMEKGVYYYVVDALEPGDEGFVDLEFQAFSNRGPELCANGVDDDGDGLVDCMDPDCTGVVGCPGPVCIPDQKTGPLVPNDFPVSLHIDTTSANNDQTVPCALGGGKDVVIQVELIQVSGLEIDCFQGMGDHVFGLFSEGQPRDPCDKIPANCADPKLGTLGCNFIMPNLQPGKYYLVVEAFKPGTEGTMDLSLSATPDHAQEICNNNIDDDGDGKIDCQDSNCASKPICQGSTCTPDQKLGILPASGSAVNMAVTTLGAGDSNSAACALGGGEDAVLGFTLVNPASLHVDYAQFGNHVFALYDNMGNGYSCDAAPLGCQSTNGQPMGKVMFTGLPAGEYFLVIEAVSGGNEGSVVLQMAAK